MDLVSPAEYARHAGISKNAVGQQIANGRIPAYGKSGERLAPGTPGKKFVNPAEADSARRRTKTRVNVEDDQEPAQAEPSAPRGAAAGDQGQPNLTRARTASEAHRAQLLRLELDERRGLLTRVSRVEDALAAAGEKIVRIVDQLPMDELAADFEAAWAAEFARQARGGTDEEAAAANARTQKVAEKIAARPSTDISMMRLKARAYLWAEGCMDLEDFSPARDTVSDPILVSLFRDLGAYRPIDSSEKLDEDRSSAEAAR